MKCANSQYFEIAQMWEEDGQIIVDAMNACQDKYEFVYVRSFDV